RRLRRWRVQNRQNSSRIPGTGRTRSDRPAQTSDQRPAIVVEVRLRQPDHDPAAIFQLSLSLDVFAPLLLVRAVPIALVLDRAPELGIGQVYARHEVPAVPDLPLHDRFVEARR